MRVSLSSLLRAFSGKLFTFGRMAEDLHPAHDVVHSASYKVGNCVALIISCKRTSTIDEYLFEDFAFTRTFTISG